MTMKIFCCLLLSLFAASSIEATRRWCFYTNWAQYRKGGAKFLPENIDTKLCTHISYAFAKLENYVLEAFEWNDEDMFKRVNKLKEVNKELKTFLAVGGWNMGSVPFSDMVATKTTRRIFITTTITYLRSHNFDGLDISWEYPSSRGTPATDKERFGMLLKELRAAFEEDANKTGSPRLLLAITIGVEENLVNRAYDIDAIKSSVDAVSLMTYDFYTPSNTKRAVHPSALHAGNVSKGSDGEKNVEYGANTLVEKGIPKELINIGIVLYGHSYHLREAHENTEGSFVSKAGTAGRLTGLAGFLAYYEVCMMIDDGATVTFLEDRGVPYLVLGNQWVGYENEKSVTQKAKFAVDEGYGGVMVWAFDVDDFSGMCPGGKKYPLLNAIYNVLENVPPVVHTTPDPNWAKKFCTEHGDGLFGLNCKEFVMCTKGNGFKSECTSGQIWVEKDKTCIDKDLAKCP